MIPNGWNKQQRDRKAAVGTVLGIKPMLHINKEGKLENTGKPHGQKKQWRP